MILLMAYDDHLTLFYNTFYACKFVSNSCFRYQKNENTTENFVIVYLSLS